MDETGNIITNEVTGTIQEAIDQNKNGQTLIIGDGRGTNITYDAELDDSIEHRTYNVPFIAEYNVNNIKTEADLKNEINKNTPKLNYTWSGNKNNYIDEIVIEYKEEVEEKQNSDDIPMIYINVHKYVYEYNHGLILKHQYTYRE